MSYRVPEELFSNEFYRILNLPSKSFGDRQIEEGVFTDEITRELHDMGVTTYRHLLSIKPNDMKKPDVSAKIIVKKLFEMSEEVEKERLWQLFGLSEDAIDQYTANIYEYNLSVRLENILHREKVRSVSDVIRMTPLYIKGLRNMGRKSYSELFSILFTIIVDEKEPPIQSAGNIFKDNRVSIYAGDFSVFEGMNLTPSEVSYKEYLESAYETLSPEITEIIASGDNRICELQAILKAIIKSVDDSIPYRRINNAVRTIPRERLNKSLMGFVDAYTDDDEVKSKLLVNIEDEETITLGDYVLLTKEEAAYTKERQIFFQWCGFNLKEDVRKLEGILDGDDRGGEIIRARAKGKTLQKLGEEFAVTRERIRQVESKTSRKLFYKIQQTNMIMKIYALENRKEVLSPAVLADYLGDLTEIVLYLIRGHYTEKYHYDNFIDAIIVSKEEVSYEIRSYLERLPDPISVSDMEDAIKTGVEEFGYNELLLNKTVEGQYTKTGNFYHRNKLTLKQMYTLTLEKYYQEGIHAFDAKELELFRERVRNDFGDVELPENDRAIGARIADIGILAGRGIYRPKSDEYISHKLANRIVKYINKNDSKIIPMSLLFHVFEDELKSEGVSNKYYLQGILHEEYGNKYNFRRDYLLKEGSDTSFYLEIIRFIKNSNGSVSKEELFEHFPGVTEIVIILATSDESILNYFGEYIHISKIRVDEEEKKQLKQFLQKMLTESDTVHGRDLYKRVEKKFGTTLRRNGVFHPFSCFSLLQHLFKDDFVFDRPYISTSAEKIVRPKDKLIEYLQDKDLIEVKEIIDYCRDIHLHVPNILVLLDKLNAKFLIADTERLVSIEYLGLNDDIVETIEKEIRNEIKATTPIHELSSAYLFPKLTLDWTPWLIYSVLKKYSTALDVSVVGSQFRQAVPIVSLKGKMDIGEVDTLSVDGVGSHTFNIEDDNWDSLIEEMLEEEYEF